MKLPFRLRGGPDYRETLAAFGLSTRTVDRVVETWPEPASLMVATEPQLRSQGVTPAQVRRLRGAADLACLAHEHPPQVEVHRAGDVVSLLTPTIGWSEQEIFVVVSLNTQNRVIDVTTVGIGGVSKVVVSPRLAFRDAIRALAETIVLVHNHPAGDPVPSHDDIALTHRFSYIGSIIGVRVVDHIVIGRAGRFCSLARLGYLPGIH